jgi:predicted RNase H-like HicB family nuclease
LTEFFEEIYGIKPPIGRWFWSCPDALAGIPKAACKGIVRVFNTPGTILAMRQASPQNHTMKKEIVFVVEKDDESDWLVASWDDPAGGGITTQGKDLAELQANVKEAVQCHYGRAFSSVSV